MIRNYVFSIAALCVFGALAGCGQSQPAATPASNDAATTPAAAPAGDAAPAKSNDQLTIGVMPKLVGIDYFNAARAGAEEAAKELGVKLVYDGPATNDVTQQSKMVETWITQDLDAIAIAPNDPDAIGVALKKARKKGIKVVTWDADAEASSRDYFVNQATSEAIAKTLVDVMAEGAGPEAKFAILTGSLTAANQNIWMGEMEKYRAATYPNMTNVSETPKASEEDQALATQVTTDMLKAYPDLQGIFAITSVALPGAAEALRKEGAAERVFLTGLATPKAMKEYVADGTVKRFVLWSPKDLGYLTVFAAVAAAKGELAAGATTIASGRLGEKAINGDQILLGDPIVFSKENIDQFDF